MSTKHGRINGPFVPMTRTMLESPAMRVLSLSARRCLDRIGIEHLRHGGNDNGKLPVTYKDFIEHGVEHDAIGPAIREAEALGFIEITERGRAGNGEYRRANRFRLTYLPTTRRATNDWQNIATVAQAKQVASAAREEFRPKNTTPGFPKNHTGFLGAKPHRVSRSYSQKYHTGFPGVLSRSSPSSTGIFGAHRKRAPP